jgi:DASS family divalent anion:Na+ symporter
MANDGRTMRRRLILLGICAAFGLAVWLLGPPEGLAGFALEAHLKAAHEAAGEEEHEAAHEKTYKKTGKKADKKAQSPDVLAGKAWTILAVFAGVILSLMLRPFPMGPMVLVGVVLTTALQAADKNDAMNGYGKAVTWLVVAAFIIAAGLVRSGLGTRIALWLVVKLGRTTLGLAYALSAADLLLAPVVPSNTARGGGILAPVFRSLAGALGSEPDADPRRAGSYLAFVGAMATVTTSAMFLTAMAANGLVTAAARDVMQVDFGWVTWAKAMIVPGLTALLLMPLVIYLLYPPDMKDSRKAQAKARGDLEALGRWRRDEKMMAGVFVMLILLWSTSKLHGIGTGAVAWIGVLILVLSDTLPYGEMLKSTKVWDALLWLGGLLSMANLLSSHGTIAWFADLAQGEVSGMSAMAAMIVLAVVYFYAMYGFSMLTAHISAMAVAFLTVLLSVGAPPQASVALIAAFSNVCACLTFYSTGPVIVYFGFGYVPAGKWFRLGAIVSVVHMFVWLLVGMGWWKVLGWW